MSRIYGDPRTLDYEKVRRFFELRSAKMGATGPLSVTMYQTEEVARRRDEQEKAAVAPLLNIGPTTRVLDIGCGPGRWGLFLSKTVNSYLGVDYCEAYVRAGNKAFAENELDPSSFFFQILKATEVSSGTLAHRPPFDLIIIAGLLVFLNDSDVDALVGTVLSLLSRTGTVYVREPIAVDRRLTLLDFPSEQLQQEYSAIYRTDAEMRALLVPLEKLGAQLKSEFELFPAEVLAAAAPKETTQKVYIFQMSA